jgi:hypothetical protein
MSCVVLQRWADDEVGVLLSLSARPCFRILKERNATSFKGMITLQTKRCKWSCIFLNFFHPACNFNIHTRRHAVRTGLMHVHATSIYTQDGMPSEQDCDARKRRKNNGRAQNVNMNWREYPWQLLSLLISYYSVARKISQERKTIGLS